MFTSKVLKKLRAGKPALCTNASGGPAPLLAGLAAKAGFDAVWIDGEHRAFSEEQIAAMVLACRAAGADPLVRIRKESPASVFRPLEMGAAGVMVPHVRSADEARWAVRNFRFAPEGLRGMDGVGPDADYGLAAPGDYLPLANRESWLVLQIEDREAVDCIDEIVAVEGFDMVFVGPADLSQSLGVPLQFDHPKLRDALARVTGACAEHGKAWGQPAASIDHARELLGRGARFINLGADLFILSRAWAELHDGFRALEAEMGF